MANDNNTATLLITVVAGAAGAFAALSLDQVVVGLLILAGGLAWLSFAPSTAGWRGWRLLLTSAVSVLSLAAAGYLVANRTSKPVPAAAPPVLDFAPLSTPVVQQCQSYAGLGTVPAGSEVLVFDRPVDRAGHPNGSLFYLDGVAERTGTGWRSPTIEADEEYVEIAAVLVSAETTAAFRTVVGVKDDGSPGAPWLIDKLPPGRELKPIIVQPRLKTKGGCAG